MQEYWELYMKPLDGYAASVLFNAGIADQLPCEDKIYLGWIQIGLQEPGEKGLLSGSEEEMLSQIEDRFEMEVLRYRIGSYVGRVISGGTATFLYYLKYTFEWPDVIKAAMGYFEQYRYEYGSQEDPLWTIYQNLLYPSEQEWQMIRNHKVCDRLRQSGDQLDLPRAIEHSAFFKTEEGRETFAKKIEGEAYNIQELFQQDAQTGLYGMKFYRIDKPHYYDIDAITLELIEWAALYEGAYDGWETSIVKS